MTIKTTRTEAEAMTDKPEVKLGDRVFGSDGHEWKVNAIGGKDKNVLHCERPVFKRFRAEDVRMSRAGTR